MPLILSNLKVGISKICDQEHLLFQGFPSNTIQVADRWSTAINDYAALVIPASLNSSLAKEAFRIALLSISSEVPNGAVLFKTAFSSYAAQLAIGMSPTFKGNPPPVPIELSSVFALGFSGGSSEQCVQMMSGIIDLWFRTGTATNTVSGVTTPWS